MKNIKTLIYSVLLTISVSMFTGCVTTPGTTGIDPQAIKDSAVILKNAARDASALAIGENPDNAKIVNLVVTGLDTFLLGTDYTPGALTKAISPMVKEVKDVKVNLAINTVLDLYQVYYGRYVKQQIAANDNAVLFLTSLRDGASQGLSIATGK
jgi:hypothetical protein